MWRVANLSKRAIRRGFSTAKSYEVGAVVHGFEVVNKQLIPEYSVTALHLKHAASRAEYVHIDTVDTNNVFSINFRTPPYSSNGIAHILEHLVLCGSKKYPVRDPFFNMLKRSLNNFMNAMTASDHTMYPFATTNAKDFDNLMNVYLDAVFFPKLDALDFSQEGHRLELDQDGKLQFKGVVLNEMKGVMSDSQTLFATKLQQELMETTIYSHLSGGDPAVLTSLTYEELREFHRTKYHPSNCLFFSYGHFPLESHLKKIATDILPQFEPVSSETTIAPLNWEASTPAKSIVERHIEGPDDGVSPTAAAQTKWCHAHVVPGIVSTDTYECFVLRLVSYLLLHGSSAPLYKALITSELAVDFSAGTGFDSSTVNPSFGLGVEGFDTADLDKIKKTIDETLEQVVAEGFDEARIDAVLHQIELSQKHIVGKFGMSLLRAVVSTWCHRGDIAESLSINPFLTRFHEDLKSNPRFLQEMLDKFIVQPRKTTGLALLMTPSTTFVDEQTAEEAEKLKLMEQALDTSDYDRIKAQAEKLKAHQAQTPNVECLPTLTIADIPTEQPRLEVNTRGKIQFVPQSTNELTYIRLKFDTANVPDELRWYLPLFSALLGQLGTSKHAYYELPTVLQNVCGGVSCSHMIMPDTHTVSSHHEHLLVETLCLPQHLDATIGLVQELFSDTQYLSPENLHQLKTLLVSAAAAANASVASSGHSLASYRAQLGMTSHAGLSECARGLTSMNALQLWVETIDKDPATLEQLGAILQQLSQLVFNPTKVRMSVVTEPHLVDKVEDKLTSMAWQHDISPLTPVGFPLPSVPTAANKAFFGFPISVNFNVRAFPTVPLFHEDHVPLSVLAQVLSSCHLHQAVRERGGAYGCGASQGEGVFTMSSYYDPHTTNTFQAYRDAVDYAVNGDFSERDVQEALLATFSSLDAPQAPSVKGKGLFTRGFTHEQLQARRTQLLQVTRADLMRVAASYLTQEGQCAVVGKEESRPSLTALGFE